MEQPIFVIGTGRCGSTLFHEMFTEHPRLAWMSVLCDRYPERLGYHRALLHAVDTPGLGPLLKRWYEPAECYRFWNHWFGGFAQPDRDLRASDVTVRSKVALRKAAAALVTRARPRLLVKITGWPRLGFLHEVFPDARFIHVYRDGRAVANSLLQVDFWRGWSGERDWRWGELEASLKREWESHGRSFVALAGIQWKVLMRAAEAAKQAVPTGNYMEVRYEDFVSHPLDAFRTVTDFCGLESGVGFERSLSSCRIENANGKWKQDLTDTQQGILQAVLGEELRRYGYD